MVLSYRIARWKGALEVIRSHAIPSEGPCAKRPWNARIKKLGRKDSGNGVLMRKYPGTPASARSASRAENASSILVARSLVALVAGL